MAQSRSPDKDAEEEDLPPLPDNEPLPPVPLDGGYGWVIVFASFFINTVADGIVYSFGIMFPELYTFFGESKSKTNFIGSLVPGVYLIVGPVASALVNKFGVRYVVMMGSLISGVFFFISAFAQSVDMLIFTWGLMCGIGFGLMYLPSLVIVSQYFARKRSIATGIATCGSGIGTFLISEITRLLMYYFGWRGTLMITAGIALQGMVFGSLFRPLEMNSAARPKPVRETNGSNQDQAQTLLEAKKNAQNSRNRTISSGSHNGSIKDSRVHYKPFVLYESEINQQDGSTHIEPTGVPRAVERVMQEAGVRQRTNTMGSTCSTSSLTPEEREAKRKELARPMNRQDIYYTGSVQNMNSSMADYVQSVTSIPQESSSSGPCASCTSVLTSMFDLSLFKSPTFILLLVNAFLSFLGFFQPFFHLPDKLLDDGYTKEQAAWVIKIIGICNVVGRLGAGILADRPWADCLWIQNVCLWISGAATIIVPFIPPGMFWAYCLYCVVFATCIASFIAMRTIVVGDLMGFEKLNNAFGLTILFQGIAGMIGSPLAAYMFDKTGSYTVPFIISGLVIFISGLVTAPARAVSKWEKRRDARRHGGDTYVSVHTIDNAEGAL